MGVSTLEAFEKGYYEIDIVPSAGPIATVTVSRVHNINTSLKHACSAHHALSIVEEELDKILEADTKARKSAPGEKEPANVNDAGADQGSTTDL